MAKIKTTTKKTKTHNNSHSNSKAMDKVKIKRVKRHKKVTTAKEKILAGIGVGSTLLGGASMVNPQSNPTQFVRTQSSETGKETSKVKDTLKKIFGVSQAKAYTDSEGITYDENTTPLEEVTEEPIVEQPVDEPVVEEPAVEEPVAEDSVVEEPVVEEPTVEPVVETVTEEPVVGEVIEEQSATEEPVVEEPVVDNNQTQELTPKEPYLETSPILPKDAGTENVDAQNKLFENNNLQLDVWENKTTGDMIAYVGYHGNVTLRPDGTFLDGQGNVIPPTDFDYPRLVESFRAPKSVTVIPGTESLATNLTLDNLNSTTYNSNLDSQIRTFNNLTPEQLASLPTSVTPGSTLAYMLSLGTEGTSGQIKTGSDGATYKYENGAWVKQASNLSTLGFIPGGSRTDSSLELQTAQNNMSNLELLQAASVSGFTPASNEIAARLITLQSQGIMPTTIIPGSYYANLFQLQLPSSPTNGQSVVLNGNNNFTYKYDSASGSFVRVGSQIASAPTSGVVGTAGVPLNADGSLKPGWIRMGDLVFYNTTAGIYSDRSGQFQYTTLNQFNDVMKQSFLAGFTYQSDPSLPAGFNPLQYASRETALRVATALGLPASAVSLTTVTGPVAPYPQYVITFPNGVVVNAGLVAQEYLKHTPDVANDMIRAEVARGGGSYVFTGANFGNGTEASVTSSSIPANQGSSYVSPPPVTPTGINPANGLSTTTVTQPGVQAPNSTVTGTVNLGTPIVGIETSSGTYVTNVSAFDAQGRNTNGVLSYGHTIEIGGIGLSAYSSFALQINGVNYSITRSVISENKITLVLPSNLPTNIPNGAQVKIMVTSTRTGIQSGALAQTLTFRNTNTTTPTHTNTGTTDGFTTGEIPGQEATGAEVRISVNSVTLRAGTTSTVNFSVRIQDMVNFGATVTSNNPSIATATVNSGTGVITIRGIKPGVATLVVHPTGITDTQYDKFIVVLVTSDSVTTGDGSSGTGSSGTGSSGTGSSGTGSSGTGSSGTGSSGTSSSNTELLATIERLNAQITQLQNQVNSLNSRIANQGSGTTVINNTDTAQLNNLRNQITDLQNLVNRISTGNANNQQFQGLQMPAGYPASGGLQYQAPAEIKGVETSSVTYTVKKGDNLWNIAKKYYGDGKQWRKILKENPTCLSIPGNTKTLKIGAVLTIPK